MLFVLEMLLTGSPQFERFESASVSVGISTLAEQRGRASFAVQTRKGIPTGRFQAPKLKAIVLL